MTWQEVKDFLDSAPNDTLKGEARVYDGVENRIFDIVDITLAGDDIQTKNMAEDEDIVLIF